MTDPDNADVEGLEDDLDPMADELQDDGIIAGWEAAGHRARWSDKATEDLMIEDLAVMHADGDDELGLDSLFD